MISHARANVQSRFRVAIDTPSTSLASCSVSPPKNRNSTTCAARGLQCLEPTERLIQRQQILGFWRREPLELSDRHSDSVAPALLGVTRARVVDQEATHLLGGDREEVGTALPVD